MSETNGRISVSEDKLTSALTQLELRIVQQIQIVVAPILTQLSAKADQTVVSDIQSRLSALELKQAGSAAVSAWTKFWIGSFGLALVMGVVSIAWRVHS